MLCTLFIFQHRQLHLSKETMRPILKRAAWSLNLALQGQRPSVAMAASQGFQLPRKQGRLETTPSLSTKFAVSEFKGDWAWYKYFFEIEPYWKCGSICYRCHAARIPRLMVLDRSESTQKICLVVFQETREEHFGWTTNLVE